MSMQLEELPLLHNSMWLMVNTIVRCKCSSYERALCINVNEIVDGFYTSIQFPYVNNLTDSAKDFSRHLH
jgi:hypothetical protein